ncbi:hypothetical protein [Micromonospora kangleipakensis]|uniref:hypothetical protein n=1 Tax=Micromonospora kangleipakensis TaxID=1077942 RepID=UPI001A93A7EE|nr:hypothetical protein [Micromonospora kangleipakensis]
MARDGGPHRRSPAEHNPAPYGGRRCPQRGIYTELTPAGSELLARARPTHDRVLADALAEGERTPELAPLVDALHRLPAAR